MPFPDEYELQDLDGVVIKNEADPDRIAIKLGLICTLYIQNPHDLAVRTALARCGDEYLASFGEHLKLYIGPNGAGRHKAYPHRTVSLTQYVADHSTPDTEFGPEFTGGSNYRDASSYTLDISAASTKYFPKGDRAAYLSATLPFSFVLNQPGKAAFQSLVHHWCTVLKPFSGYAGLAFIQSSDSTEKLRTSRQVYPLGRRFPGLEIDNPSIVANQIGDRIKGVNWLTVLSDESLKPLGGRDPVLSQLDDNYIVLDYESGVVIQAGKMPQPGDVNRQNIPHYYRRLSHLLKPLRMVFPEGHSFIRPDGVRGTEATNKWLARFDE